MPAGLYIHVPFCRRKCRYCDFAATTETEVMGAWLQALLQEMALVPGQAWPQPFDTLYLGGGTPSLLPGEMLAEIFLQLARQVVLSPEAEITLEANPDDVTPENLRCWRALGVNRLSVGVQSLDDEALRWLGRRHDAAQARLALERAREAGFVNLSVDLIYALPGQSLAAWLATLAAVLACAPEHVSCYQLTAAAQTPLGAEVARGAITLPGEEEQRQFFLATSEFLERRGYSHYEVSNFARGRQYYSRHNSKYWQHSPYLGLGPAAHSFDGRRRSWNIRVVPAYCQSLQEGRVPVAGCEVLSDAQLQLEALALGLRTRQGVALTALAHVPEADRIVAEFCASGLLTVQQGRVCPTREGFLVADSLALLLSG
ncbi:MAG: radical SAM family heme chaperone HemW [Desulfobacca sp.]|uniref:radical SAM family heme chaperone HemW n=1 Tax=Desulfobacca sp. TaxID=2067990 RepID=UPI00404954A0